MEGNQSFNLIWLVLGFPLFGFLIQSLLGKRIEKAFGRRVAGFLAVIPIVAAFGVAVLLTKQLAGMDATQRAEVGVVQTLFSWIKIASIDIPFEVRIDTLSMTMVLIITGIGSLIHLYATGYMAEEKDYTRFFTYLNLFIAAMLILVLGNNLALLFIGWEGVGVCSYLLIGFWYKDLANSRAANKAFIVNRIGDVGLTVGMFLLVVLLAGNKDKLGIDGASGRWLSYDVMLPHLGDLLKGNPGMTTAIALCLFVGACGKSAQFPLYLWLPDAMAGPTPVSALIHAATMVTSGIVLLNRMNIVFQMSPVASAIVCIVGAFTALFAALIAFGQTDIKKVLAYSTVSQLGFMFMACGAGAYWVGMFHVTTHAFFKALLFLGSGAVIHAMAHNQDMRNYGKLFKYIPITAGTMFIGYFAIAGIPGLSGFFSKEAILGYALANDHAQISGINFSYIVGWVGLGVAMLTSFYMTRMTLLTFFGKTEQWRSIEPHHHDEHDHAHDDHGHHDHAHHAHEDHGPDEHGFFYTDEELAAQPHEHEHHHDLDKNHTPHEVPVSMWFPLVVLGVLSAGGGYVLANNHLFEHWLYPNGLSVLKNLEEHPHHMPGMELVWWSIAAAVLGIVLGLIVYLRGLPKKEGWDESKWSPFRRAARDQFGYDNAMVSASVDGGRDLATFSWRGLDATVIDGAVNGSGWLATGIGKVLGWLQNGFIRAYAAGMLLGGVAILGYLAYALFTGVKK
jgi:NADH-quinone oxidoreductase subunit L